MPLQPFQDTDDGCSVLRTWSNLYSELRVVLGVCTPCSWGPSTELTGRDTAMTACLKSSAWRIRKCLGCGAHHQAALDGRDRTRKMPCSVPLSRPSPVDTMDVSQHRHRMPLVGAPRPARQQRGRNQPKHALTQPHSTSALLRTSQTDGRMDGWTRWTDGYRLDTTDTQEASGWRRWMEGWLDSIGPSTHRSIDVVRGLSVTFPRHARSGRAPIPFLPSHLEYLAPVPCTKAALCPVRALPCTKTAEPWISHLLQDPWTARVPRTSIPPRRPPSTRYRDFPAQPFGSDSTSRSQKAASLLHPHTATPNLMSTSSTLWPHAELHLDPLSCSIRGQDACPALLCCEPAAVAPARESRPRTFRLPGVCSQDSHSPFSILQWD